MRVYLSGKMTGLEDHGFPLFHSEAARLRALGYDVVNPAELPNPDGDWVGCIVEDLKQVETCVGIALLDNWVGSYGAFIELFASERLNHVVLKASELVDPYSEGMQLKTYKLDLPKIESLLLPNS